MIPKIIHYCWVGRSPKPKSVLHCIESWRKYCPDYKIIEWNEDNYDFTKNKYMKQSYEKRKWGFVPDYARLDIVYNYGGIYLDTDVEIISNIDHLLDNIAFMSFENTGDGEYFVNCGQGFGAEPNNEVIGLMRDYYDNLEFIKNNGSLNMLPSPNYTTAILKGFGLIQNNKKQTIRDVTIYSSDLMCPKNFRTGKIKITACTVSIHHFTASWLDEKIKGELIYQQRIYGIFGHQLGKFLLYIGSVINKYFGKNIIYLPKTLAAKLKVNIINYIESLSYSFYIIKAKIKKNKKAEQFPVILDTSIDSDNCGDKIIMEACEKQLSKCLDISNWKHIPTHRYASEGEEKILNQSKFKILCGTNILSGNMKEYGLWKLKADITPYVNTILMGTGFDSTSSFTDHYTKEFFNAILNTNYLHSVRDSFSENKLKNMGIKNVINTGCPTMWGLTEEHCKSIPAYKAENVVCTITDYCRDYELDQKMLDILLKSYKKVYFWIQGKEDFSYLCALKREKDVEIISSSLKSYDQILRKKDLDYVGTRLHAGIRSLCFGHRSIIISIDNRAKCIAQDTGLIVVERSNILVELENKITSEFFTKINMPWENIKKWKNQFSNL